jgi:hypothetical protein
MQLTIEAGYAIPREFIIEVGGITDETISVEVQVSQANTFTCKCRGNEFHDSFTKEQKKSAEDFVRDSILSGKIFLPSFIPFDEIESIDAYEGYDFTKP